MIVDCIPDVPDTPTAHRHNSRLSFELFAGGRTFIADPGTYLYSASAEWRNRFRGTAYHNTVMVDGVEMDHLPPNSLFRVDVYADVKVNTWRSTEEFDFLDAEHDGYGRLPDPVTHRRRIYFDKKSCFWIIRDELLGKGIHEFELFFHFAPVNVRPFPEASTSLPFSGIEASDAFRLLGATNVGNTAGEFSFLAEGDGSSLALVPLRNDGLRGELTTGWISYQYGEKEKAPVARYVKRSSCPTEFLTLIYLP